METTDVNQKGTGQRLVSVKANIQDGTTKIRQIGEAGLKDSTVPLIIAAQEQ